MKQKKDSILEYWVNFNESQYSYFETHEINNQKCKNIFKEIVTDTYVNLE